MENTLIPDTRGPGHARAQRRPRVPCKASGPWDPNVGADTALLVVAVFHGDTCSPLVSFNVFFSQRKFT